MDMKNNEKLQEIINSSNDIVFFDGAGTSTLSGIKDFRGKNGIYKMDLEVSPEYLLSINCLENNPFLFYKFYKNNLNCLDASPNIIHEVLKRLNDQNKLRCVITQNIDGLHKKAGLNHVLEIHGTIYKNHCMKCGKEYDASYIFSSDDVPLCSCGGIIRPQVVLYGEDLNEDYEEAIKEISSCETLIVAGSSLTVNPAASLITLFKGKRLIILNDTETSYDKYATLVIHDNLKNIFENLK